MDTAVSPARPTSELPLPVELLEKIIYDAWSLPLSKHERVTMATSLSLVNHTFLSVFIRIAMRDVHIMTPAYAKHYLKLVRPRASFAPDESYLVRNACQVAHRLCRSLTFHIDARPDAARFPDAEPAMRLYADGDRGAEAVSATLYLLSLVPVFVPGLRRVALAYTDWGFDDVRDQCRLLPMPAHVAHLELRYAFSPALARVAARARAHYTPAGGMRWRMPQVRRLTVRGAPPAFVSAMAEMCPMLRTLEVDEHVELDRTWTVPEGVITIVLDTRPALDVTKADWWSIARAAAGSACFAEVAAQDATEWQLHIGRQRLKRICSRLNVDVEYF